jgi:hypothetical protein
MSSELDNFNMMGFANEMFEDHEWANDFNITPLRIMLSLD